MKTQRGKNAKHVIPYSQECVEFLNLIKSFAARHAPKYRFYISFFKHIKGAMHTFGYGQRGVFSLGVLQLTCM